MSATEEPPSPSKSPSKMQLVKEKTQASLLQAQESMAAVVEKMPPLVGVSNEVLIKDFEAAYAYVTAALAEMPKGEETYANGTLKLGKADWMILAGNYKLATEGPVTGGKPLFGGHGRLTYDAWKYAESLTKEGAEGDSKTEAMRQFVKAARALPGYQPPKQPVFVVPAAAVKKVKAMPGEATDGFKRQCTSTGPDGRVYCVTPSWLMIDRLFAPKPIDTAPPPTVVVQ